MNDKRYRTRVAPTTSGLLHIGHARTFLTACARARERNGVVVLRIDDIDFDRCTPQYESAAIADMKSAGVFWDEGGELGGKFAPYRQSERLDFYENALRKLINGGFVYPSYASRSQIREAAALPARRFDFCDAEPIFPPQMRPTTPPSQSEIENLRTINWRFRVPDGMRVDFFDNASGEHSFVCGEDFGDFLVWRKSGAPSYELASSVDDALMEITEIVRGEDLLLSTARQILIWNALALPVPEFYHCPLLRDEDGKKLSKTSMRKSGELKWLIRARTDSK